MEVENKNLLRLYFVDILKGYSKTNYNNKNIYIKHMDSLSSGDVDLKKQEFYNKAIKNSLPSFKEKEEFLLKEGLWDENKNKELENTKNFIAGLKQTKQKLFREQDIKLINEQIFNEERKLFTIIQDKKDLIGYTAEDYSNKKINEYYMFISLYKDVSLKDNFFSESEFEELENKDISNLVKIYNDTLISFNEKNLKRIALLGSHLTLFNVSEDNPFYMYGKPIIYLTFYQIELFGYAKYFKNQLSYAKHKPPDDHFEDPDKLIEWIESSKNVEELMNKSNHKNDVVATSIVGASKNDLKKAGLEEGTISLAEEAKKKGGTLNMQDLIKLHGI